MPGDLSTICGLAVEARRLREQLDALYVHFHQFSIQFRFMKDTLDEKEPKFSYLVFEYYSRTNERHQCLSQTDYSKCIKSERACAYCDELLFQIHRCDEGDDYGRKS